jgi:hypothetical protein
MGDTRQSLSWIRERAWFQISAFIVFFMIIRWGVLESLSYLLGFVGISADWTADVLRQNEIVIQILSFVLTEILLGLLSQRRGFVVDFAFMKRIGEVPVSELLMAFMEKFFLGFVAASLAIALSVFAGFSILETPSDWLGLLLGALPKLLLEVVGVVLWFFCLELFRYPLWTSVKQTPSSRLQGRVFLILFQGWLLFRVAIGGTMAADWNAFFFLLSVWVSAQIFLWAETSWAIHSPRHFWPQLLSRVAFCSSFVVSLLHIYGLPSSEGRHEVSLVYSIRGPNFEILSPINFDSFLGQIPVLAVLFGLAFLLLRRSAQSLNRLR